MHLSRPVVAMRVAVVVARSGVSRRVAMFVDVPSIVVIAAVATCDRYGSHHYQNAGGGFVNHHLVFLAEALSRVSTTTQNGR